MKNLNIYGFITLYGALFLVILFKVLNVPVTCDELPTVSFYSKFSFWEIMMYPDNIPNNHILNTLLTKCCIVLFGKEQWAIRLPNLISFIFFSAGVFYILKLILKTDSLYFLPGALLFVNPYLLDFFGLCRGYGISITLETISLGFLLAGYTLKKPKYLWYSLFAGILSSYANFTALVFWISITVMVGLYFLTEDRNDLKKLIKPTIVILVITIAYLGLIRIPIQKMHSTNEFQYWTSRGFYQETFVSLVHNWYYGSALLSKLKHGLFLIPVGLAILINLFFAFRHKEKKEPLFRYFFHPGFIVTAIFLLPVVINLAQVKLLGTPNLSGRTALFFYPLIALAFVWTLSFIPKLKSNLINRALALFAGIILLVNLSHRVSLKSVREWSYDQNTLQVMDYLKEKYKGQPVSLKTSWFFHSSFSFYSETGKAPWLNLQPYDYNIDITTPAEYYYIFSQDYDKLEPRFEVVYKLATDRWLLKQKINRND
jgi:hypothetical protein